MRPRSLLERIGGLVSAGACLVAMLSGVLPGLRSGELAFAVRLGAVRSHRLAEQCECAARCGPSGFPRTSF